MQKVDYRILLSGFFISGRKIDVIFLPAVEFFGVDAVCNDLACIGAD